MIRSIQRAMNILEIMGESPEREFGLADIASRLSLDKGTCSNILKTLSSQGFVQQSAPRKGYKIGYCLYRITGRSVENEALTKVAREDVNRLGNELNETAILSVIRNDRRVVLYETSPERSIVVRTSQDRSLYKACTGRAIIANYSPAHLERLLNRVGLPSQEEWPELYCCGNVHANLMDELIKIRLDGFAFKTESNIVGFAAPIFKDGHVVGSVGTYLPEYRLKDNAIYINAVIRCARSISEKQ